MNCAECGKRLPDDARFCSACGRAASQQPALVRPSPGARPHANLMSPPGRIEDDTKKPSISPHLPTAFVLAGCAVGVAVYWSASRDERVAGKAGAERIAVTKASATTSQSIPPGPVQFSMRKAMQGLYGNYDPVVEGAYWTVSGAPKYWSDWNGKAVAIRPLISRSDDSGTRHVLVTNSVDVKDGMVVQQGAGCRTCKSLVGAALFERRGSEWQLVADHRFLIVDGAWGAPPSVAIAFRPAGSVELQISRGRGNETDAKPTTSVLIDKDRVVKTAMAAPPHPDTRPKPRPVARSPLAPTDTPFPSSVNGP
jgi:hypothetical protein